MIVREHVEEAYFLCALLFVIWWRFYNDGETEFYESVFEMWPFYEWFNIGFKWRKTRCCRGAFVMWPIIDGFMEANMIANNKDMDVCFRDVACYR